MTGYTVIDGIKTCDDCDFLFKARGTLMKESGFHTSCESMNIGLSKTCYIGFLKDGDLANPNPKVRTPIWCPIVPSK